MDKPQWSSKIGFILAASGSAIGLGNIVFFSANAYKLGAGAFYIPYLLSLFFIGIPLMVLEMGLGGVTKRAFPQAMYKIAGQKGEFIGWWALLNATFITMYYITILSWVLGMWFGAFGKLWEPTATLPKFAVKELANPAGFFFSILSSYKSVLLVLAIWILNIVIVRRGIETIEKAVRWFVPLMWIFMIILIIRGITLPYGIEGIYLLFTPNFELMSSWEVWQGAISQILFSLSLGFGIMTAYASYLPKESDHVNNAVATSLLNCSFEYIAGLAIFSILFAFSIVPKASTLTMMFFIVPQGIAHLPAGVITFGILFFTLLLLAGLSSSISLIEALISAIIDKFNTPRRKVLIVFSTIGIVGSILFALPKVVDSHLAGNGTLGLTLLDLTDHWAFSYGLLIVALVEAIVIGWLFPVERLTDNISSSFPFPKKLFVVLVKYLIPVVLGAILFASIKGEFLGLYGTQMQFDLEWSNLSKILPPTVLIFWLITTITISFILTKKKGAPR